jgi:thiol-disulfide isomerase/thioredoxin
VPAASTVNRLNTGEDFRMFCFQPIGPTPKTALPGRRAALSSCCHVAAVGVAVLCLAGCADRSGNPSAGSGKFTAADSSAKTSNAKTPDKRAPQDARGLLEQMAKVYSEAASYADSGEFHILTEEHGRAQQTPAIPYSVTLVRPNKLRLHVMGASVVCDGDHFWASIMSPEFAGQVLMLPAPEKLSLPQIFADPKLSFAAHGTFDLPVPQLALLLSDNALEKDLAADSKLELLEDKKLDGDGDLCHRVRVERGGDARVYWIDSASCILRRFEFPTKDIQQQIDPEHALSRLEAWVDFQGAQFQPKLAPEAFEFEAPKSAKFLNRFIEAPPQPPSPLLDKPAGDFTFVDLEGHKITKESVSGKVVVFDMWATWCGWCFRSFPNLEKVYQKYKNNDKVVIIAVSSDDPTVTDSQVKDSFDKADLHIPIARDLQETAKSAFQVSAWPTMIVLGTDGSVQDLEKGYRADLAEVLPKKLEKLLAGENLAAEEIERYQQEKQKYERELADALVGGTAEVEIPQAEISPRSEPATFKLTQLWSTDEVKSPGNLLIAPDETGAPHIFAVDGARSVAELDMAGKLLANHPLEIPETTGVSFLRTGVDGKTVRYFAAFASPEQQLYLCDAEWKLLTTFPEGHHPGLSDVRLADLAGNGQLNLQVSYWGAVGVQTASLAGRRLAANRMLENVSHLTVVGPDSEGKSRLLASTGNGTLVWLDAALEIQGEIALPNRALLTSAVARSGDAADQICALSSIEVGLTTAVGISADGHELWSYELPRGVHQRPLEMLMALDDDGISGSSWLIAGPDGSLHFLGAKGELVDKFNVGEILTGLAPVKFDERPGLLVATAKGITAFRCDPL